MSKKSERILLFSLFAICLAVRIAFITQKNLWFDEVFSWQLSLDSFYTIIVRTSADIHPPLYYFVLKIWNFIFGDSVFSIRILSALFTSSAVFFIYPVCRRILNPVNTFIVLILYGVSPLNLYYSQEARMSAMNLFLNAGSVYFLLGFMDNLKGYSYEYKNYIRDKKLYFFVFFTAAALYTHYFSFFLILAQLLYIAVTYGKVIDKYKPLFAAYNLVVAVYLLWVPTFLEHLVKGQVWRTPQTLMQVLNEYVNYVKDLNLGLYYHYTNLSLVKYFVLFYAALVLLALIGMFLKRKNNNTDNSWVLNIFLVIVPLILAGIISFKQKVEFYRYLSIIVPYILIMIVYGLSKFNWKFLTYPLIGCLIIVNVFGVDLHYSYKFKNDDYRGLISEINNNFMEGDRIYVEPHYYGWIIDYYKKQENLQIPNTAYIRFGWNEVLDSINVQNPQRFWAVFDYSAVDTAKYSMYIRDLNSRFSKDFYMAYYTAPYRIDLYRFSQK